MLFPFLFFSLASEPQPPAALIAMSNSNSKISPDFATRLARLKPQQRIRVIVFFRTEVKPNSDRQQTTEAVQQAAEQKLNRIRIILEAHQGQLLAERPNVLGAIPLEITVAGVYALAESEVVRLIVENQGIFPVNP